MALAPGTCECWIVCEDALLAELENDGRWMVLDQGLLS